ncbi:hypothetical protein B0J11DRAFT_505073 [Dendryphion nanum]|uniref:Uncharacterized protein n=1 Tax=Dendryphion nanum TaxID=256645 RepID=A0A9P9E269_9PLEO|nr:hypothetical protein B0J11DRAFT_505073 [Dendryphion nanum]
MCSARAKPERKGLVTAFSSLGSSVSVLGEQAETKRPAQGEWMETEKQLGHERASKCTQPRRRSQGGGVDCGVSPSMKKGRTRTGTARACGEPRRPSEGTPTWQRQPPRRPRAPASLCFAGSDRLFTKHVSRWEWAGWLVLSIGTHCPVSTPTVCAVVVYAHTHTAPVKYIDYRIPSSEDRFLSSSPHLDFSQPSLWIWILGFYDDDYDSLRFTATTYHYDHRHIRLRLIPSGMRTRTPANQPSHHIRI